ncbi:MAG: polyprenyl synthetase family protein, partial [Pseudomonadota bacterium]
MTALPQNTTEQNALVDLQTRFETDMKEVNAHILNNMQSDVPLIPQLANYLIASGGKRVRPLLTLSATALFKGDMKRAHRLAAAVEFIHTATLLHDDVVDDSEKRRGQESANVLFGNEASVLVGDFLFSRAFQLMTADGSLEVLKILSDASAIIAEGEVKQLSVQSNLDTTLEDYFKVIEGKTAALFAAACEVGPVIARRSTEEIKALRDYGHHLGMVFQITDDLLDYSPERSRLGKAIGDDFREGKMTAPIIFAIESANDEEKEFWQRTISDKDQHDGDFEIALDYLQKYNCLSQSLDLIKTHENSAINALSNIQDSDLKTT